jgi:hypothetical protein
MKLKIAPILFFSLIAGVAKAETTFVNSNDPKYKVCQKELGNQKVEITTLADPVVIDQTKTIAELSSRLHSDGGRKDYSSDGINTKRFRYEVKVTGASLLLPNKQLCAKLGMAAKLEIKSPVIYIAKEYPVGSCMYQRTLEHEQMHYKDNIKSMEQTKAALAAHFEQNYGSKILVADEKPNNGPVATGLKDFAGETYSRLSEEKAKVVDTGTHTHEKSLAACKTID